MSSAEFFCLAPAQMNSFESDARQQQVHLFGETQAFLNVKGWTITNWLPMTSLLPETQNRMPATLHTQQQVDYILR